MKIAVEGCAHGELDKIYDTIAFLEKKENVSINLLLCCGDFQSVRNKADLQCMAVPPKYQKLNSFYKYYSGEKKAPILTIFIGGNHEASNYLQELPYGGWVAPNIYYLGYAGIVRYGGVRIGGLSGIFKSHDYLKGHYEHPPYTNETKRSAYHVRNLEVFRLKQITTHIDIFMSHDWPKGIYNHGNVEQLLKKKSFFREEVENNQLGSPAAAELMYKLKPSFWFSAHLHVKFPVVVEHQVNETNCTKETKFLALDKCLPNRDFLQVFDFPHDNDMDLNKAHLELDPEWLAILKSTNQLLNLTYKSNYMPGQGSDERWQFTPTEDEIAAISTDFGGDFSIPENFVQTVASHDSSQPNKKIAALEIQINPQTELICAMLGITNPNAVFLGKDNTYDISDIIVENRGEISSSALDDDVLDDDDEEFTSFIVTPTKPVHDPAEISLDELDDSEDAQYTDTETADSSDAQCTDDGTDDVPSTDTSYEELNIKSFNSLSSSLSLPFPKNSDSESKDDSLLDISFSSESNVPYSPSLTSAKSSDSLSDTDAEQLEKKEPANLINSRSSESEPPIKKIFKRRNMALFTNSEDESQ